MCVCVCVCVEGGGGGLGLAGFLRAADLMPLQLVVGMGILGFRGCCVGWLAHWSGTKTLKVIRAGTMVPAPE